MPAQVPARLDCRLALGTDTARFTLFVPRPGCVSIVAPVKGKKAMERLYGPVWLEPGAWVAQVPAARVASRSGTVELFEVDLRFVDTVGRAGRGERQFIHPTGIGWDPVLKSLYVADTGNDRIVRLDQEGRFMAEYGGFGLAFGDRSEEREDSLDEPYDVAAGGFSNIYVTDQNNDRVAQFDAYKSFKGNLFPKAGDRDARLNRPRGITTDGENHVWVVDGRADRVLKLTPNGDKLLELGGFGWSQWQFKDPVQVAVDADGRIFVSDRGNRRVQVFDRFGSHVQEVKDHLKSPTGLGIDGDGLLYVTDDETGELNLYSPSGRRIAFWTEARPGDRFRGPNDVVVLGDRVFLLDAGNNRVVRFERFRTGQACPWQAPAPVLQ